MATTAISQDQGVIDFVVTHPSILVLLFGAAVAVIIWQFLESRQIDKDHETALTIKEAELQAEKEQRHKNDIQSLKGIIEQQTNTMASKSQQEKSKTCSICWFSNHYA